MELLVKELKYGSETGEVIVYSFKNELELISWIDMMIDFTNQCKEEEDVFGESLYKYSGEFSYGGVNYEIYLDC